MEPSSACTREANLHYTRPTIVAGFVHNSRKVSRRLKKKKSTLDLPVIGWKERVDLPDLGIKDVHVKIDTGATTSAIHGEVEKVYFRNGIQMVRFVVRYGTIQAPRSKSVEAELLEYRRVKSSNGHNSRRPVVLTHASIGGLVWAIELTLANRETMGMPMLLGRQSLKNRFLVDPGKTYLLSERPGKKKVIKKKKKGVRKKTTKKRTSDSL